MRCRHRVAGWLGVFAGLLAAGPGTVRAAPDVAFGPGVPLEQVAPGFRDHVRAVLA